MNNSDYKSFLRIVYAICIFFVLYLIFGAFQKGAFSGTSHDDPRLMSYEEMKGCENNLQIPHEWRFLADQNDRQKRNPPLFSLRTEAERLESQRRFMITMQKTFSTESTSVILLRPQHSHLRWIISGCRMKSCRKILRCGASF